MFVCSLQQVHPCRQPVLLLRRSPGASWLPHPARLSCGADRSATPLSLHLVPFLVCCPAEYQVLLEKAEAAGGGASADAEAATPPKQLLPPAVPAGDLAAETDVSGAPGKLACI